MTVLLIPGIFVGSSHADHDGGGPGQGEQTAKGDEKSQTFPAIRQDILNKSKGGVAASCKEHCLNTVF